MRKVLVRWQAVFGSGILVMLIVTFLSSSAQAQSPGPVLNPANQHFYEAVAVSGGIDWFDARVAAELQSFRGVQGHLVTITSEQEDVFIATNFPEAFPVVPSPRLHGCEDPTTVENTCGFPYWLGGFQPPGSPDEPEGYWEWVTGEPFVYTNWVDGEPNDFQGREEDCLDPHPDGSLGWNDSSCDDRRVGGYVVEYDKPSKQVIERPLLNPANQHFYEAVAVSGGIDWFDARVAAELQSFRGVQGHLVTITSEQEDVFIATNFPEAVTRDDDEQLFPYWYGGFQPSGSLGEPEGDWEWVTGEPFDYTNWAIGEPNDFLGREEDCLLPHGNPNPASDPWAWNDARCDETRPLGYVVEYDKPNESD